MDELNISSFIQTLRPGFKEHDKQESAVNFLLSSINDQEYAVDHGFSTDNLGSKKISRLMNQLDPVPEGIKKASLEGPIVNGVLAYFKRNVMNDLNPYLKDDTIDAICRLIEADSTISRGKKNDLMKYHEDGNDARFLPETFLYALNRPNKKVAAPVSSDDIPLLTEANYECPLCQKKLVEYVKGIPVKNYCITQIFPETLDEKTATEFEAAYPPAAKGNNPDNLIALDTDCSHRYLLNPTVDEYKNLCKIKSELSRAYKAKLEINNIQLEADIRTILSALNDIRDNSDLVDLEYNALHVEEKFTPENYILKARIQMQVVTYYRYIEKVFSESACDFDVIASEIRISSSKLEKNGLSQEEVIDYLSEWIRKKSGLSPSSKVACDIVVSFFIQNCEVFHK